QNATGYKVHLALETFDSLEPENYSLLSGYVSYDTSTITYTVTELANGTTYYFVVTSTVDSIESGAGNEVTATPHRLLLNDTGITWGGDDISGNNATCTSNISSPQDCNQGRDADATNNDNSDGHAGFSFTKLDANGDALAASASSWLCVKDNVTGLVWEVKQNMDGSADVDNIHDADNTYRWGGKTHLGKNYGEYYDDWDALVDGSNNASFCGFSDWRVPTIKELVNLVSFDRTDPSIDTVYFPNTYASYFWSASPYALGSFYAWGVGFYGGDSNYNYSSRGHHRGRPVRLVRGGQ
ncbi:MAG: DUF1566 domain-containing protein, partial [Desulfobacterales bacterium]|nr:DUF1566 domain-containing protein [Desulfobacterales bacterium]